MNLDELKAKLVKAEKSYKACGCKVYLEEIRALTKTIQDLEASVKILKAVEKWTVIYLDEYGRKQETIIEAKNYEEAVAYFEDFFPSSRAVIFQKH